MLDPAVGCPRWSPFRSAKQIQNYDTMLFVGSATVSLSKSRLHRQTIESGRTYQLQNRAR